MNDCFARSRRVALILASGLCLGLAACEEKDTSADALKSAHVKLASLSPFGTPATAVKNRSDTFNGVIGSLQNVARDGNPSQAAAASILIAQSQSGLAEPAAAQAAELERTVLNHLGGLRSRLGQYLTQSASAAAAASYDPSKELAEIEKSDKEKEAEIKTEQAKKAQIDKEGADLQTQARSLADEARAKRTQAGSLTAKIPEQTAIQGERTLIEARKLSRQADALEVKAADLDAQASKVLPQGAEIQNSIDRLNTQRDLLAKERGDIAKRAQAAKDDTAEQRAAAAKTAEDIKKAVAAIEELRAGDLNTAHEEANKWYTQASIAAKKAVQEMKATAQMTVGTAEQALADIRWARARGCQAYATALESIASATPALTDAGQYKTKAEDARNVAKELLEKVREGYKAADTAYNASGAAGDAKANLDKLNARLRDLVSASGGDKDLIPSRGEPAPAPETPATDAAPAAAAPADASSPQASLQSLLDMETSGNYEGVADMFLVSSDADKALLRQALSLAPKMKKLDAACKAKFNQSFLDMAKQMGGQTGSPLEDVKGIKAADLPVKVEGDAAEFTLPNGQPFKMVKKDGKWLIDPAGAGIQMDQLAAQGPKLPAFGKAVDELTTEVEAGKYANFQAFLMAFGQKMGGGGGGG